MIPLLKMKKTSLQIDNIHCILQYKYDQYCFLLTFLKFKKQPTVLQVLGEKKKKLQSFLLKFWSLKRLDSYSHQDPHPDQSCSETLLLTCRLKKTGLLSTVGAYASAHRCTALSVQPLHQEVSNPSRQEDSPPTPPQDRGTSLLHHDSPSLKKTGLFLTFSTVHTVDYDQLKYGLFWLDFTACEEVLKNNFCYPVRKLTS